MRGRLSYDAAPIESDAPQPIDFQGTRAGLLGHPAWLSGHAMPERTDPIARGLFITERLFCGDVPNLPIEDVEPLSEDPNLTLREKLEEHRSNPTCAGCHQLMDGIGLGLEAFDEYGRERMLELDAPVDDSGVLIGSQDGDGPFNGLSELNARLASSPAVSSCLARRSLEFFTGSTATEERKCALERAEQAFLGEGGSIVALVVSYFASPYFLQRYPEE